MAATCRRTNWRAACACWAQWRPDARLDAWVFGIVRNAWIDEVRARQRGQRVFAPEEQGANVGETPFEGRDLALSVQTALARLPEEQRMAIALVLIEGLSYREAAQAMGVPVGTVMSRLSRARQALRAMQEETPPTSTLKALR